jgi:hypothetical protein
MPNRKEEGVANPEYSLASLIFNFQFSIILPTFAYKIKQGKCIDHYG